MQPFELHPRLAEDTVPVGEFPLSTALLMDEARFAWALLVPRRAGIADLHDLAPADRAALVEEAARLSEAMKRLFAGEKTNVAALGNQVRQFHVHVISRRADDAAWPNPVWGAGQRTPLPPGEARARAARLAKALGLGRE